MVDSLVVVVVVAAAAVEHNYQDMYRIVEVLVESSDSCTGL